MKKARIIMLSIAVITVVGSAFAFKPAYSDTYCIAAVPTGTTCALQPPTCDATPLSGYDIGGSANEFCYVVKGAISNCATQSCVNQAFFVEEPPTK